MTCLLSAAALDLISPVIKPVHSNTRHCLYLAWPSSRIYTQFAILAQGGPRQQICNHLTRLHEAWLHNLGASNKADKFKLCLGLCRTLFAFQFLDCRLLVNFICLSLVIPMSSFWSSFRDPNSSRPACEAALNSASILLSDSPICFFARPCSYSAVHFNNTT